MKQSVTDTFLTLGAVSTKNMFVLTHRIFALRLCYKGFKYLSYYLISMDEGMVSAVRGWEIPWSLVATRHKKSFHD